MGIKELIMTVREATTDFNKFYTEWEPVVTASVSRNGFSGYDAEDLVQDIFVALNQGDYLVKYDPNIATFSTYIWGQINVRILDRRRALWKKSNSESVSSDDFLFAVPVKESGYSDIDFDITVKLVYDELYKMPSTKTKNLAKLFFAIVDQIKTTGAFNQTVLAEDMGISRQAVSCQVRDLARTSVAQELKEALHA